MFDKIVQLLSSNASMGGMKWKQRAKTWIFYHFLIIYYLKLTFILQDFEGEEFLKLLKQLIQLDADWVPDTSSASLYIRPTFISTDVSCCDVV